MSAQRLDYLIRRRAAHSAAFAEAASRLDWEAAIEEARGAETCQTLIVKARPPR